VEERLQNIAVVMQACYGDASQAAIRADGFVDWGVNAVLAGMQPSERGTGATLREHSGTPPQNSAVVLYRAMLVCRRPYRAYASCDRACVLALT
jgi:hypothetical protein